MANITKAKHAFNERFSRFDEDIELVDYWTTKMRKNKSKQSLLEGNIEKYDTLKRRAKNIQKLNSNRILLATHLKQTIYSSYIKDIYEEVTEYLRVILGNILSSQDISRKKRILGDNKISLSGKEIVMFSSLDELYLEISTRIIQQLEQERSTLRLIEKIIDKLGISHDKDHIKYCIHFLNVRHYLVHGDGVCSNEFIHSVDKNIFKFDGKGYIKLNFEFISEFKKNIKKLIDDLDLSLVNANILDDRFIHLNQ